MSDRRLGRVRRVRLSPIVAAAGATFWVSHVAHAGVVIVAPQVTTVNGMNGNPTTVLEADQVGIISTSSYFVITESCTVEGSTGARLIVGGSDQTPLPGGCADHSPGIVIPPNTTVQCSNAGLYCSLMGLTFP